MTGRRERLQVGDEERALEELGLDPARHERSVICALEALVVEDDGWTFA
jgi:hypothetical protein